MKKKLVDYVRLLQNFKPFLEQEFQISEISVFGSYVRGDETPDSDLDVLVSFSKTPDLFRIVELIQYLEMNLGIKVDLVPNQNLKPRIAQHILAEKIDIT